MRIAGIDPSLSNFGLAKGIYQQGTFGLTSIALIQSQSDKKNQKTVRKNSDDLNRAKTLVEGTLAFIEDCDLIFCEIPVGSQSARAMASYGVCIGILAGIDKPLIQVTPSEVKLAACHSKTATKRQMINWATTNYPHAPWLRRTVKGTTTYVDKNEHIADALAAIHAGLATDQFKQLIAYTNSMKTLPL